jgi:hypothetical protein
MKQCIVLIEDVKNIVRYLSNLQYGLWYAEQTNRELLLAFPDYDKVREYKKSGWETLLFEDVEKLYNTEYVVDIDIFSPDFLNKIPEEPDLNCKDEIVYIYGNYTDYKQYHNGFI